MAKSGHTQQLPTEVQVILTEGDVEVCNVYVKNQEAADALLESWKAGTYRLLTES
jgi:hypothetical protein